MDKYLTIKPPHGYFNGEIKESDIFPTIDTGTADKKHCVLGEPIAYDEQNLKRQLCNKLIQEGKVKSYDVIRHSYSNSRMKKFYPSNQENHDCSPTLDTRCDCLGVVEPIALDEQNGYIRKDGCVGTLTTDGSSPRHNNRVIEPIKIRETTTKGYAEAYDGDSINLEQPNSTTRRGRVGHQMAQTLTTQTQQAVVNNYRIRKLTPRECFRLMGVKDKDFDNIAENQSNSSLYHLAGDSIVVNVLMAIFRGMV